MIFEYDVLNQNLQENKNNHNICKSRIEEVSQVSECAQTEGKYFMME